MMKNNGCSHEEETAPEENEKPPTSAQMGETLQIFHDGVHHRSVKFQMHYEYGEFINNLPRKNTK